MKNFVKMIGEICAEEEITMRQYSDGWVLKLCKSDTVEFILGHQFWLNSASVRDICADKCAASQVMTALGIPNVRHELFVAPNRNTYKRSCFYELTDMLDRCNALVCKPNTGASGKDVYKVRTRYELETAYLNIMKKYDSVAVCPYFFIKKEMRFVVLNGEIKLGFTKHRPALIGDGIHTVRHLLLKYTYEHGIMAEMDTISNEEYDTILKLGEEFPLNWKHNLVHGADVSIILERNISSEIKDIVYEVCKGMNIKFASIDIISSPDGYRVLEINSGVMMEHFASLSSDYYDIAKGIYRDAILTTFSDYTKQT